MTGYIAIGAFLATAALIAIWWWRHWNANSTGARIISIVGLLDEPIEITGDDLREAARRAWGAQLGDADEEGRDGFVIDSEMLAIVCYHNFTYGVIASPELYVKNLDEAAESIPDLRARMHFFNHRAWFSIDVMGADEGMSDEETKRHYRRIGLLFSELIDEHCLLIFLPDLSAGFVVNEETIEALRSEDIVDALQESASLPVLSVASDDPEMVAAVEQARQSWPDFLAAFRAQNGEDYAVKAPVTYEERSEFIWISVVDIEGDRIAGTLANDPADLGPLKFGSEVTVALDDLNDWAYTDSDGEMVGGYTVQVLLEKQREESGDDE